MKFKKLIVTGIVAVALLGIWAMDYAISRTYSIELVSMDPQEPVADVKQHVTIVLRLTRGGKPVEGHTLYCLALDGGTFRGNRGITGEDGLAQFTYVPYSANSYMPAQPVRVTVADESNSVIFEVNAQYEFVIDLKDKPKK